MSEDSSHQVLARQINFMQLDECRVAVRSLKHSVERHLPDALDRFYERVQHFPEASRFFTDRAHIEAARSAQLRHWVNISAANLDGDYLHSVQAIGRAHARVGLEPHWYIGGYALITEQLVKSIVIDCWPKGFLGRNAENAEAAGRAVGGLMKCILLDIDLAVSVYMDALEEARRRIEESRAAAEQQQSFALDVLTKALDRLNHGDLTVRLNEELAPQYKKLQDDLNATVARLHEIMRSIMAAAEEVSNASGETSTSTADLSQRTEEQAASIEQTSAAMEQISAMVKKNAENVQQAHLLANSTFQAAVSGGEGAGRAVEATLLIEQSSRKISDIIGVIDEIAFQTNLLALNAAVEAARAGEAGRGFAVVASEVRSLAQRSSEAAKDIKELIQRSSSQVQAGVALVNQVGASLKEIVGSIDQVRTIVSDVAAASSEQSTGIAEINRALSQLDEMTQQNSALVEQNAAVAKSLEQQAATMRGQMEFFRMGDEAELAGAAHATAAKPASRDLAPPRTATATSRPPARHASVG